MLNNKLSIGNAANYLGVSIDTLRRWDKNKKLRAQKSPGGHRYYSKLSLDLYKQNIFALATKWITGKPQEPKKRFYCPTNIEFKTRLLKLQNTLGKLKTLQNYYPLIVAIAGEIGNNSYDHNLGNWPDIFGIFFTFDVNKKQIVLADRGLGVFRTLKRVKPSIRNDQDALHTAFTETISGRAPEARGNGLKFVRKVITDNPLRLSFYSGSANVVINKNDKKIKCNKTDIYYSGCLAMLTF